MSALEYDHQFEIYYGLHGGPPVFIGGGSGEDLDAAYAEAERVNTEATDLGPGNHASPGTEAFYRHMGAAAGVSDNTEAASEHYRTTADAVQDAWREVITGGNAGRPAEK